MECMSKKQAIHPGLDSKQFDARMAHLQRRDESKGGKQKQAAWLANQGSHQRLAALLATDKSDEFSTNTEQRVENVILLTIYGLVGRKAPTPVLDTAVSPKFMKELTAEKPVRSHSFAEQCKATMRTPDELKEAEMTMGPLGRSHPQCQKKGNVVEKGLRQVARDFKAVTAHGD